MDALELRLRGAGILAPIMDAHGFRFDPGEADLGSGGLFARGAFIRGTRRLEFSARHALGEVTYRVRDVQLAHEDYMRVAAGHGHYAYPGFSADPLDGLRHLASDLSRFASAFLVGSDADFVTIAGEVERTRPPRGFAALFR